MADGHRFAGDGDVQGLFLELLGQGSRVQPFRLDVTATALRQPNVVSAKVVKVAYYNASGMRVSHPGPGITFQQTTYADGQTLVKKILR